MSWIEREVYIGRYGCCSGMNGMNLYGLQIVVSGLGMCAYDLYVCKMYSRYWSISSMGQKRKQEWFNIMKTSNVRIIAILIMEKIAFLSLLISAYNQHTEIAYWFTKRYILLLFIHWGHYSYIQQLTSKGFICCISSHIKIMWLKKG